MSGPPTTSTWADDLSGDEESDRARLINNNPNLQYQSTYRTMQEHEEGLNRLGEVIKRQKYVANELASEVDLHNEILEDIDTGMTRTDVNLQKNTRNIRLILKKSSTCGLWMVIVILAAVMIGLAII